MSRRRRSRSHPDTGVMIALGAGAVLLGIGVYMIATKPSTASGSTTTDKAIGPLSVSTQNLTLRVGQVATISFPTPPAPATTWQAARGIPGVDVPPYLVTLTASADGTSATVAGVAPGSTILSFQPAAQGNATGGTAYIVNVTVTP